MVRLIQKFARLGLVDEFVIDKREGTLLQWENIFTSLNQNFANNGEDKNWFIIHFRDYLVHVDSYATLSLISDVFPTKWTVSVSNDNSTWQVISTNNDNPACSDNNKYFSGTDKYYCSVNEEKHFYTNYRGYSSYLSEYMDIPISAAARNECQ